VLVLDIVTDEPGKELVVAERSPSSVGERCRRLLRAIERRTWSTLADLDEVRASPERVSLRSRGPYHAVAVEHDDIETLQVKLRVETGRPSWMCQIGARRASDGERFAGWACVHGLDDEDEAIDFARRLGSAAGLAAYRVSRRDDWVDIELARVAPVCVGTPFRRAGDETEDTWTALGTVEGRAAYRLALRDPDTFPESFSPHDVGIEGELERWDLNDGVEVQAPAVAGTERHVVTRALMAALAFTLLTALISVACFLVLGLITAGIGALLGVIFDRDFDLRLVAAVPSGLVGLLAGLGFAHMQWTDRGTPARGARRVRVSFSDHVIVVTDDDGERQHDLDEVRAVRLDDRRQSVRLGLVTGGEDVTLCEWQGPPDPEHASRAMARQLATRLERPIHHHDAR
jgi:hypothetical protein